MEIHGSGGNKIGPRKQEPSLASSRLGSAWGGPQSGTKLGGRIVSKSVRAQHAVDEKRERVFQGEACF